LKHVPHLYVANWEESVLRVSREQQHHLSRVLRASEGDDISYTNGKGLLGSGTWAGDSIVRGEEQLIARPSQLVMAVAPPENKDRLRFTVEKLAELGIEALFWLETRWGGRRIPATVKQSAWAVAALEQSRGAWLMEVGDRLRDWSELETPIVVCNQSGHPPSGSPRTVVIGPEGGLDPGEIPPGSHQVSLGETVLRIETAAIVAATKFRG
jgi:16S rRNA (uracil1498-N3)-methyltransferase